MTRYLLLLLMLTGLQASAQLNSGELITKNGYWETPIGEVKREVGMKATLHGEEGDFMLDTGAPVFISTEIQDKYKFPYKWRGKARDASGKKVRTDMVIIDTIRFGPFVFTNIPALVFDLKKSPLQCYGISGNIGSNLLRHLVVQFDVNGKKVAFTDNEQLLKQHLAGAQPMYIDAQSDVYFRIKVNNEFTDTVHYDSGDGQLYEISKTGAEALAAKYPASIIRSGYGTLSMGIGGVAQPFQQYIFKPGNISLGSQAVSGGTICIAGNNHSRMGRELLNYGVLQLNYKDSTYAFQPYNPPYIPDNYDYGLKIIPDDDILVASCVWDNGVAAQQGIAAGDEILKINDVDLSALSKCEVEGLLRKAVTQNTATLTVTYRHKKQQPKTVILQKTAL